MYSIQCTAFSVQFLNVIMPNVHCIVFSVQYIIYSKCYTATQEHYKCGIYTVYCALHTLN